MIQNHYGQLQSQHEYEVTTDKIKTTAKPGPKYGNRKENQ